VNRGSFRPLPVIEYEKIPPVGGDENLGLERPRLSPFARQAIELVETLDELLDCRRRLVAIPIPDEGRDPDELAGSDA